MKSYLNFKRIGRLCLWLIVISGIGFAFPANAQPKVRGSISKSITSPSAPTTRVVVFGQPNIDLMNVLVENINICVSIPDLGLGNPVALISQNFMPSLEWMAVGGQPDIANGRAYYTFIGNDTSVVPVNLLTSVNNPIIEVSFDNGTGWEYVQLNDLTDAGGVGSGGGPSGQSFWYVQINTLGDITDYDQKFYQNAGSKIPINGGSNAPSFVETVDSILLPVNTLPGYNAWNLYPNPAAGQLHMVSGLSGEVFLQISDQLGRLMWEQKTTLKEAEIFSIQATRNFSDGVYLLSVKALDGQLVYSARFVVCRE